MSKYTSPSSSLARRSVAVCGAYPVSALTQKHGPKSWSTNENESFGRLPRPTSARVYVRPLVIDAVITRPGGSGASDVGWYEIVHGTRSFFFTVNASGTIEIGGAREFGGTRSVNEMSKLKRPELYTMSCFIPLSLTCTSPKSRRVGACDESSIGFAASADSRSRWSWMVYPSPLRLRTSGRDLFFTLHSRLKLNCFSSVGANESSIGIDASGPTTPLDGCTSTVGASRPPARPPSCDVSKANANGMCSRLTRWTVSRARWPRSIGPKLWRERVSETSGSRIVPTRRNGWSILSAGMRKRQNDSCSAVVSGTNSKTISNLRPARTAPLRVWQRNGRCASASPPVRCFSASASQTNSYGTFVGLTT